MALRAKVKGQWRLVSKAMARRFRAKGIEVTDAEQVVDASPVVGPPPARTPPTVHTPQPLPPPPPHEPHGRTRAPTAPQPGRFGEPSRTDDDELGRSTRPFRPSKPGSR